jgi:tetratricopeptide (TPR) repeat protein
MRPPGACRVAHDHLPSLWAGEALAGLAPRSLVLCTSDEMCGLGLYLQTVEGRRPDVGIVPRQHLWNDGAVRRALGRSHPALAGSAIGEGRSVAERLAHLAGAQDHDVYWEVGDGRDLLLAFGANRPELGFGPDAPAPLARIGGSGSDPGDLESLKARFLAWMDRVGLDAEQMAPCDLSFLSRRILARDFLGAGLVLAWSGRRPESTEAFRVAVSIKPDYAPALVNLAILDFEAGRLESAISWARAAVRSEPMRPKARATLGRLLMAAGRVEEGRRILGSIAPGGQP